jgi:hypothetical protein
MGRRDGDPPRDHAKKQRDENRVHAALARDPEHPNSECREGDRRASRNSAAGRLE